MAKRRPTIPIAHADDLPTIEFNDERWQAIEHAYARQLNADVRQQITTVTTQYLKDCVFERTAAPKAMACERIERIRRAAGDLEKVLRDSKPFSASTDDLPRKQQQQEQEQQQQEEQQEQQRSVTDYLIGRHFNDPRLAPGWRGDHLQGVLRSLVFACDCALNDLGAAEGRMNSTWDWLWLSYPMKTTFVMATTAGSRSRSGDGQAWDWWIQALTQIVQRHDLPYGARIRTRIAQEHRLPAGARIGEVSKEPSPFVALVCALQEHVPARHTHSKGALAKAIRRAQGHPRDK